MHHLIRLRSAILAAALFLFAMSGAASATNLVPEPPTNPYQGLWYNENESGWGVSINQHEGMIFAVWYTYDQAGAPIWYVMPQCSIYGPGCTSDLYKVTGGTPPSVPWNGTNKNVTKVGVAELSFTGSDHCLLTYTLDGVSGSKIMIRQIFASGATPPVIDYSDLWWNPAESGWGIGITHQFGVIFATWFNYDASGKPTWYVASNCQLSVNVCHGDLYTVSGGVGPNMPWNISAINATKVGFVDITFSDRDKGILDYSFKDGTHGSRPISRQPF